jgi:hypothetical protein
VTRRLRRTLAAIAIVLATVLAVADQARADNIAAAGDVSNAPGGSRADVATARLLGSNGIGLVLALGDLQYECGEASHWPAYHASWGAYRSITRPAQGNHEMQLGPACDPPSGSTLHHRSPATAPDAAYYDYFQGRTPGHPGYYSFDYQGWHFVVLNTNCGTMTGGCSGPMLDWFKADLAEHRSTRCTVVYGHFPYHQSGPNRITTSGLRPFWPVMVLEDVDLYLAGHIHWYERLAPMRTAGNVDRDWGPADGDDGHAGVPTIIAGTGGRSLARPLPDHPNQEARRAAFGVLKLVPDYPTPGRWVSAFKQTDGTSWDRVAGRCH